MSCLLPQFKCKPDTFCVQFKSSNAHNQFSRSRDILFRTQCSLSTTTSLPPSASSTAVLDREKLQLPSIDADPGRVAADGPWAYLRVLETMAEENFGETLDSEPLTTSDEAVIAASTELVDLAKAAAKMAKDAALLSGKAQSKTVSSALADTSQSKWIFLTEKERASVLEDTLSSETSLEEENSLQPTSKICKETELTNEEIELEEMLSDKIAVRSRRKRERKARRVRAAEKAAATVVTLEFHSNKRKKHTLVTDVERSDPLHVLKRKTSISSRLSSAEETKFSEGIQDLLKLEKLRNDLVVRCGGQPTFAQWATAAGTDQKTLRKRLDYGIFCKEKMIMSNVRLVMSIAKKYQNAGLNLKDLVQEGCRGLIRGAEKFDSSKGCKFSTYAHWWIKQTVRRLLSDHSRTIRLPIHMVESTYKVKEARKRLYIENGRQPDDEEVAEAAGLTMRRLSAVLLTPKAPRSLDQKFGDEGSLKLSEIVADPNVETAEQKLIKQFMKQDVENMLKKYLTPRENCVLRKRYGLENGRMNTLKEIGESMGVCRERIRQIELSAFRKLRNKKIKHLEQYLMS